MIIFLCGQDTYRSRQEIKKIIDKHNQGAADWVNFFRLDVKENGDDLVEEFRHAVQTVSMFDSKKLVFIENIFFLSDESQRKILEILKLQKIENNKDLLVVFWSEECEEKSDLFKFLKKSSNFIKFDPLKGSALRNWIKEYVSLKRGSIESRAIDRLIEGVGNDLWRLSNEIDKLITYQKNIDIKAIEQLIKPEIDLNIFKIIDALGFKNKKLAIRLISDYFEKGEDEMRLLGMFIYQFRNLIKVKADPEKKHNLHPFVLNKTKEEAKNFSFTDLKKIYYRLLTIDFQIKVGKGDVLNALNLFIATL